jgi:hypothetical protein
MRCAAKFDAHFERMWDAAEPMIGFAPAIRALEPSGKRGVVVIAREKGGETLPFVFRSEPEALETPGKRRSRLNRPRSLGFAALPLSDQAYQPSRSL